MYLFVFQLYLSWAYILSSLLLLAIGAGKTVISIAIILQGIEAARANRSYPRKSSASLVVVPPGLIDQWKSEIKKFTDKMPNVICIYVSSEMDDRCLANLSMHIMILLLLQLVR
jgi:SNF2 family DNA or RNA helicase